ncbi:hypothetical protein ACFQ4C_20185 [Larkinella insperata]|uniref:Uncharacterized protein n=1 Tax=Larkinella insperata TaxID=332158 RepID=A0ABW3QCI5_9BACT|nr:hypothetical protein [Larkinella insperata]
MKTIYIVFFSLCASTAAFSQDEVKNQPPKTKLETFSGQYGRVYIKAFSEIGTVSGSYETSVIVEAREYTNAVDGKKEYGISIEVKKEDRVNRSNTSYIDYDEIS